MNPKLITWFVTVTIYTNFANFQIQTQLYNYNLFKFGFELVGCASQADPEPSLWIRVFRAAESGSR